MNGIVTVWSPRIPKSHASLQTSHKKLIGRERPRTEAASAEKQQRAEQRLGLCKDFGGRSNFPGWPGVGGIMWPVLGASSGIGGIFFSL